jgi:hypothetical protein
MVIYTHLIWTATIKTVGCGAEGDEIWRLLLGFAPFAIGASLLLGVSKKLPEVHKIIRWFGAPLLLLLPLALLAVWPTFITVTLGTDGICDPSEIPGWHTWWAPVQLFTLSLIVVNVVRARSLSDLT